MECHCVMQGQLWNATSLVTISSADIRSSIVSTVPSGICDVFSFPDKCDSSGGTHVRCTLIVSPLSHLTLSVSLSQEQ